MVKLVSFAGPAQVGKTTTANAMVKSFNKLYPENKVQAKAFADSLYETASFITGIPVSKLKSQDYKNNVWTEDTAPIPSLIGLSPRRFLQLMGTECFRNIISNTFWVETTINHCKGYDVVFLEDARFPNEYTLSDLTIELEREGIEYACDHESSMPPPPELIDFKISLYPEIDYDELATRLYKLLH